MSGKWGQVSNFDIFPFLLMVLTALTVFAPAASAGEVRLTKDAAYQGRPAIYEDKVVYEDSRRAQGDIYLYNLTSNVESRVTTDGAVPKSPAIYGDKIVWQDTRGGDSDIYLYDLATGNTSRITKNSAAQAGPAIYADKIVWQDFRHGDWDIYLYDIAAATATRLTTDGSTQTAPVIYGDKVAWEDYRNGAANPDIYMYDLTAAAERQLTTDTAKQVAPAIYAGKVVWEDYRHGAANADIYLRDLSGGGERRITDAPKNQRFPAIQGNRIVWQDNRISYFDAWLYDLTTGRDYRMSTHKSSERHPRIYGDNIVWYARRQQNSDVFLFEIKPPRTSPATDLGAPNGLNNWYITNPSITLKADEPAVIRYQWDSVAPGGWRTYAAPFHPPEGRHTLYFYGDCAGKEEAVKSVKMKIDTEAPTASVDSAAIALGANILDGFKVDWSYLDPSPLSRFVAYDVEYKVGGRRWAPWLTKTKTASAAFFGSLGRIYGFRVRARDGAGNFGAWSAPSKTVVPDDQDKHLVRRRGFDLTAADVGSNSFNGTLRYSRKRRDRVTYAFVGNSFTLYTTLGRKRGRAKIYVDGDYVGTVDAYARTSRYRREIFTTSWLASGRHTVKVVNQGTRGRRRFDLDAHVVGRAPRGVGDVRPLTINPRGRL